jgi:hypothetical protein
MPVVDVSCDRALADLQCDGDVGVAAADCEQPQDFSFPWSEAVGQDRSWSGVRQPLARRGQTVRKRLQSKGRRALARLVQERSSAVESSGRRA